MECSICSWVDEEFSSIELGDKRLNKRFNLLIVGLMKKAQETVSSAFEPWSDIKAGYRFLSNTKVTTASILKPHQEQTLQRIRDSKPVLLLQDTTYIDYRNRHKTKDLECVTLTPVTRNKVKGLILHSQLAVNTEGLPLGIVNQQFTERKG